MNFKERMNNVQINMKQFYTLGIACFLIVATASTFTLITHWSILAFQNKISSTASVIFNFGIVLFFRYLLSTLPGEQVAPEKVEEINFDEMIENIKE